MTGHDPLGPLVFFRLRVVRLRRWKLFYHFSSSCCWPIPTREKTIRPRIAILFLREVACRYLVWTVCRSKHNFCHLVTLTSPTGTFDCRTNRDFMSTRPKASVSVAGGDSEDNLITLCAASMGMPWLWTLPFGHPTKATAVAALLQGPTAHLIEQDTPRCSS
jgi:hypothetical protein